MHIFWPVLAVILTIISIALIINFKRPKNKEGLDFWPGLATFLMPVITIYMWVVIWLN